MKNKIIGVYSIRHEHNLNKIYIGSSLDIKARWYAHKNLLKKNQHPNKYLQNISTKFGLEKFKFEILKECSLEDRLSIEQEFIDSYQSYNPKNGYNFSKLVKGVSSNQIAKIRGAKEFSKVVYQIDKNNNIINKFTSLGDAYRKTNIKKSDISRCANFEVNMAGGYLWRFEKDIDKITYISKYHNEKIYQYTKDNKFIKEWDSIQEASDYYARGNNGNITSSLKGRLHSAYGSIWKSTKTDDILYIGLKKPKKKKYEK